MTLIKKDLPQTALPVKNYVKAHALKDQLSIYFEHTSLTNFELY